MTHKVAKRLSTVCKNFPAIFFRAVPRVARAILMLDFSSSGYNVECLPKLVYNSVDGIDGDDMKCDEQTTNSMVQVMDGFEGRTAAIERNLLDVWSV